MNEEKGFTLIELLAAITILGIILTIAIPQVIELQNDNKITKYKKYSESLLTSGKLYVDSYSKDMFGNNTSGCYDIPYQELKNKGLAKDIKMDGVNCNTFAERGVSSNTFVRVLKSNENYSYDISIKCVNESGGVLYKKLLAADTCDGTLADETGPEITFTPDGHDWYKGLKAGVADKVTIKLSDKYGLAENASIQYAWYKEGTSESAVTFKTKNFKNKRGEGKTAYPLSITIEVPQGVSGEYILIVKAEGVRDANGLYMTNTTVKSKKFKLDNTKPEITSSTNSKNGVWTNGSVDVTATAEDTHSGVKTIYYSYKNSNATADLKEDWNTKTPNGNNMSVAGTWTANRSNSIYVIAVDKAGNESDIVPVGKIMIDATPPTINAVVPGDTVRKINVTQGDTGGSGLVGYCIKNTSTQPALNDSCWVADPTANLTLDRDEGTYFLWSKDKAGNISKLKQADVKYPYLATWLKTYRNGKVGQYVQYSANGCSSWRVFYVDGGYTYMLSTTTVGDVALNFPGTDDEVWGGNTKYNRAYYDYIVNPFISNVNSKLSVYNGGGTGYSDYARTPNIQDFVKYGNYSSAYTAAEKKDFTFKYPSTTAGGGSSKNGNNSIIYFTFGKDNGLINIGKSYWLSDKHYCYYVTTGDTCHTAFRVYNIEPNGRIDDWDPNVTRGIRPLVRLKSNVRYNGKGTGANSSSPLNIQW